VATTEAPKVPVEETVAAEATTPQTRQGLWARINTDEDVRQVKDAYEFARPVLKVAGAALLMQFAPVTGTAMVINEVVGNIQKRRSHVKTEA
jgi:hypothetical protein